MSSKKRILIFIDWFSPGYKAGGPISSNVNMIENLKDKFEFYVITRNTDYCESIPYSQIISDNWNTMPNGTPVYYISKAKLSFIALVKISRSKSFDTVFINGIYSLYFSLFPLIWFKYFSTKPIIVSARGMLSDHTFSSGKLKKKLFYALTTLFRVYKGIIIHATNEDEVIQIRKNLRFKGEIRVAPNLPPKLDDKLISIKKNSHELRLVSIARISPEKNTLFALNVLKDISRSNGFSVSNSKIIFDLFGTIYNQVYWNECCRIIAQLPENVRVSFCGPVEKEKIQQTLRQYHFLFMPSLGENYGHSIVESFLAGRPVIISDQTPWKNLSSDISSPVGWDLSLENTDKFGEVIHKCSLMDQQEYDRMCRSTLDYAKKIVGNISVIEANLNLFS